MSDRRGSRFTLEALFLVGLAVALTLAHLRPLEIAGIMLLGWLIVAALEWAAWRGEPHFGSGLPPRYYVPSVNLPPAQPLDQVQVGYPEAHRDEAPTWIASRALRAEVLGPELGGDWPHGAPQDPTDVEAEPSGVAGDPWSAGGELPAAPENEPEPEPEPEQEPQPEPVAAGEQAPPRGVVPARAAQRVARYSFDPLGDPKPRRRLRRGASPAPGIEVPARPDGPRALPGRAGRQEASPSSPQ